MFHQDTNTLKPETLFEPRPLRTTSIHQVLSSTQISELGTAESYHKTYGFWTNPDNINTTKGQSALYRNWEAEDFVYYEPEEDISQVSPSGIIATQDAHAQPLRYRKCVWMKQKIYFPVSGRKDHF